MVAGARPAPHDNTIDASMDAFVRRQTAGGLRSGLPLEASKGRGCRGPREWRFTSPNEKGRWKKMVERATPDAVPS